MEIEAKIQLGPLEIDGVKKKLEDIIDNMRDSVSLWEDDPYTQHDIKEKNFVYIAPWMKKGEYLRIRDEDGDGSDGYSKKVFTYKGKNKIVNGLNCREEVSAEWEDDGLKEPYESLKGLFEALGFKLYAKYDKKREKTEFQDGLSVSFDKIMQLPIATRNFIEIEGPTKKVFCMIKQLGLEDRAIEHRTYADLVRKEKN
jgi:predicted adenylyl cyclase CyaB